MKLVIDISEKDWKFMRKIYKETGLAFVPNAIKNECVKAVYDGVPLSEIKEGEKDDEQIIGKWELPKVSCYDRKE